MLGRTFRCAAACAAAPRAAAMASAGDGGTTEAGTTARRWPYDDTEASAPRLRRARGPRRGRRAP